MAGWKGTPGPWGEPRKVSGNDWAYSFDIGPDFVVDVYAPNVNVPLDGLEANAHGMAAVPQLVEALLLARDHVDRTDVLSTLDDALRAAKVLP